MSKVRNRLLLLAVVIAYPSIFVIGYHTSWEVGVAVFFLIMANNLDRDAQRLNN